MKNSRPARKRVPVSVGDSARIIRELQGLSQNELAQYAGIS
jgi:DNA-binding XRE family transcriptional regulator